MPANPSIPLYLFAKAPEPGRVKTRMQPYLDPDMCAALAAQMLDDSARQVSLFWPGRRILCVTPNSSHPQFDRLRREADFEVTEQIDALEVMGVNALNYLVFPKIVALMLYPFIIAIAMYVGIFGGWFGGVFGGFSTSADFVEGLQLDFIPFHVTYAFIKTLVFAFVLATIPSFHGFYMKGGALEVGKASTTSFVWTSVIIIILNYILTQLMLG